MRRIWKEKCFKITSHFVLMYMWFQQEKNKIVLIKIIKLFELNQWKDLFVSSNSILLEIFPEIYSVFKEAVGDTGLKQTLCITYFIHTRWKPQDRLALDIWTTSCSYCTCKMQLRVNDISAFSFQQCVCRIRKMKFLTRCHFNVVLIHCCFVTAKLL